MVGWAETATKDGLTVACLSTCMCLHISMGVRVMWMGVYLHCYMCMYYNAGGLPEAPSRSKLGLAPPPIQHLHSCLACSTQNTAYIIHTELVNNKGINE